MHDDLGAIAVENVADGLRGVKIEGRPGPGERTSQAGERCVRQGRHERSTEPPAGPRDRDPHRQSALVEPARRAPYWRS